MLDHITIFLELVRAGTLRGAALRLSLDETTVSRRLSKLEDSFGARLFDRGRGGWTLTEAGTRLVPYAESIDSEFMTAVEEVSSKRGELSGSLRVITTDGFGAYLLLPGLQAFHEEHPTLRLEVSTSTRHSATLERDFDAAITLERPSSASAEVQHLTDYELRCYASHSYLEKHATPGGLEDLRRDHTIIWYIDALLDVEPLRLIDALVPGSRAMIQTNNISGHLSAVRAGLGIALLPTYIGEGEPELRQVLPDQISVRRSYWLTIPRSTRLLARVTAFRAALETITTEHPHLFPPERNKHR
ncbi:LysR family transcriptional regulator [Leucobacter sp. M11]|uniref:LysR family transcriptional regulator n=1 Tax=Leucobacter sp. M11 TaxID=2993565 RepID=UPI002D7E6524|nr:LysR family transcriptional regulator [Leucobacter sp. M11]MEB4616345.1 LysR family transcriptional regulator [Leucobacter sp. M11]